MNPSAQDAGAVLSLVKLINFEHPEQRKKIPAKIINQDIFCGTLIIFIFNALFNIVLVKPAQKNVGTKIFSDSELLLFSTKYDKTLEKIQLILFSNNCNFQLSQLFNLSFNSITYV